MNKTATYTTAPADYDYPGLGTEEVAIVAYASNGKAIRKVVTNANRADAQRARYASGCHMAADDAEYAKLVAYKLVKEVA